MKRRWICMVLLATLASVALLAGNEYLWHMPAWATPKHDGQQQPAPSAAVDPPSLMLAYCSGCHANGRSKIDFDEALVRRDRRHDRPIWESVVKALRAEEMPPSGQPSLTGAQRRLLIAWAEERVVATSKDLSLFGRSQVRRLNRTEYVHAVRDLVGVHFQPAEDFPADDGNWSYSKDAPALSASLQHSYSAAADAILSEAAILRFQDADSAPFYADDEHDASGGFDSESPLLGTLHTPAPGTEAACARAILTSLARRAYRRPPTNDEIHALCSAFDAADHAGNHFDESVSAAVKAMLTSPSFLYVVEALPGAEETDDPFALASRLALFLWKSVPDEELLDLAARHDLDRHLAEQVQRMLKHAHGRDFAAEFADHWLGLRAVESITGIEAPLARAMRQETEQFVAHIVREDRNVLEFLDADYTFVNERLAKHYGIRGVHGEATRRVSTTGTLRGGLLSQAGILALTSNGGQTSAVQRGKWVLDNLLDSPPPPPPAGLFEAFKQAQNSVPSGPGRRLLERHRNIASCAECHAKLDGIGLTLENFDAFGLWRTTQGREPIDAAVTLPTGELLNGPTGLKNYLKAQTPLFIRCLSGKLLGYALNRGLGDVDQAALAAIPERVQASQYRFSSLVVEVVRSRPFHLGWDARDR